VRGTHGWSLRQCAEIIAANAQVNMAANANKVWRWEHWEVTPDLDTQFALARALDIPIADVKRCPWPLWLPSEQLAGVSQPWTQEGAVEAVIEVSSKAPVDRRGFTVLTGTGLTASTLPWLQNPGPFIAALNGRQVTMSMIETIEQRIHTARCMDSEIGGAWLIDPVMADLQLMAGLLRNASYSEDLGQRLFRVTAELTELAAWSFLDAGRHAAAQQCYLAALRSAHTAGDRALGAYILTWMSYQTAWMGNPQDTVQLIQTAEASDQTAVPPAVAGIIAMHAARAHAKAGDNKAHSAALTRAFTSLDRAKPGTEPGWAYWIDESHFSCEMGFCFLEARRFPEAADHLSRGLDLFDEDKSFARDRAFYLSQLAVAHVRQREVEQACVVGKQTLDLVTELNSPRVTGHLYDLQRELHRYQEVPVVRGFTEQIQSQLVAT